MGVARIVQREGHTESYRGYSSDFDLNIVGCLLRKRLTKGESQALQDPPPRPPGYALVSEDISMRELKKMHDYNCQFSFIFDSFSFIIQ